VLELTEGAAVEDAARTFATMRHLRSLGVRLAIDDFGTGYSSLSYLMDMPVDILKLDRLFVEGLGADRSRHLLTRGILDLARALNKLVIAEGIEREEQAARLDEYGCTLGQGYFFARPVDARVVERRLAEEAPADAAARG
jgi:EAL domain-containing protein (putative c-di-GMP-specific phosphodiesterase class I)